MAFSLHQTALARVALTPNHAIHRAAFQTIGGLAPTPHAIGRVAQTLCDTVETTLPHLHTTKRAAIQTANQALQARLRHGGTPEQFRTGQNAFASSLTSHLEPDEMRRLLNAAGFSRADLVDGLDAHLRDLMSYVDSGAMHLLCALGELTSVPSVSDIAKLQNPEVQISAKAVAALLRQHGFKKVERIGDKKMNPTVYGEIIVDHALPTIYFYAHHDKQPTMDPKRWESDPWTAILRARVDADGVAQEMRLFGRGSTDDMAGIIAVLGAVDAYRKAGVDLPVNIVCIFEGEEEIGSPNFAKILAQILKKKKPPSPALVLLTDSKNVLSGIPTVGLTTRGVFYTLVEAHSARFASHSGINSHVPNAHNVLDKLVGDLLDARGDLVIPGITDVVPPLPAIIRESYAALTGVDDVFRAAGGMYPGQAFVGDPAMPLLERTGGRFALGVLATDGPQSTHGASGIVVPWARKLLMVRVPPGMDANAVEARFHEAIRARLPQGVQATITSSFPPMQPWVGDAEGTHPYTQLVGRNLALGYNRTDAVYDAMAGSIGFLPIFQARFPETPLYAIGIEDPWSNAHAENESAPIDDTLATTRGFVAVMDAVGRAAQQT
jgi:cysteinylglycine-S-conjugate dipeptidase